MALFLTRMILNLKMFPRIVEFIKEIYQTDQFIPLHEPRFSGNEKKYLAECIDSTFVSSVGKYVDLFEEKISKYTGAKHAIAVVNGTQALFVALQLAGATRNTEVITQSLTFVATANAIHYTGANPIFLDVDKDTMGLSPDALRSFLKNNTKCENGKCINSKTGSEIVACVPMHTFGHPCRIQEIKQICDEFCLILVEDAAESLGSYVDSTHTGLFGQLGVISFNGNKIITTGGGGMILTDNGVLAKKAKHLTTTAKVPHPWEFVHDEVGYNFRMPNLNAALGVAQLETLPAYLENKQKLAENYQQFFSEYKIEFVKGLEGTNSNHWLNAVILENLQQREDFLKYTNENGVMTRCLWTPMHQLHMYQYCQKGYLENTQYLYERVVNLPSSVIEV
jgi:perosamine synthetase